MMGREVGKCSENKVEGEDNSRTVYCLRGRLLAERMASRIATEEAEKLEIRLLEVGMQLEKEGKSRNRAEKKLEFLMKKLQTAPTTLEIQNLGSVKSPKGPLNLEEITNGSCSSSSSSNDKSKSISAEEDAYMSCGDPYEDSIKSSSGAEDVDVSTALVPVDREVFLDATVEQVLELLKRAKEEIQISIDHRKKMSMDMIQVG